MGSCPTVLGAGEVEIRRCAPRRPTVQPYRDGDRTIVPLHELAHLAEASHSRRFRAFIEGCPHAVRAEGFLEGVSWQQR